MRSRRVWACLVSVFVTFTAAAQDSAGQGGTGVQGLALKPAVGYAEKVVLTPPLRDLARSSPPDGLCAPEPCEVPPGFAEPEGLPSEGRSEISPPSDPVLQTWPGLGTMPVTLKQWEGSNNTYSVYPPGTTGDVGPNHYVQWVHYALTIWDKDGSLLMGPINGKEIWAGTGTPCYTYVIGEPTVLYDRLADRWVLTQSAGNSTTGPFYHAVAVSQTPDPTGAYYLYCFQLSSTTFNDYPKLAVWPDGYYMTTNQFASLGTVNAGGAVYVFDRSKMLAGQVAAFQYFNVGAVNIGFARLLPSNVESAWNAPPPGTPNYIAQVADQSQVSGATEDDIRIWQCHVDWTTPANSTLGLSGNPNQVLPVANFNLLPCVGATRNCIPQPGTAQKLDAVGDRAMYRLNYRHWSGHDSLVFNHSVWADGSDRAGVRWYELRKTPIVLAREPERGELVPPPGWTVYQQGTFAPSGTDSRWMGSAGMDHSGDLAVGYSVSSGSVYPSIRYAGRLAGDTANQLVQGEAQVIAGTGSQTGSAARWGGISTMTVDPVDDCTFWYTTEYIQTTGTAAWRTRIAAFKFASCTAGPTGTLAGHIYDDATGDPLPGAAVTATSGPITIGGFTDGGGAYSLTLPPGTYTLAVSSFGYVPQGFPGLVVSDGLTTKQDAYLAPKPKHAVSGVVTDAVTGWPLYASLVIEHHSGGTVLTDPVTGSYSVLLPEDTDQNFTVSAMIPGYTAAIANVHVGTADVSQNFALSSNPAVCTAPGYHGGFKLYSEDVEGATPPALPGGWAAAIVSGSGQWSSETTSIHPPGIAPHGGAKFLRFNSWSASAGTQVRLARTSGVDLRGSSPRLSFWMYHEPGYNGLNDRVQVQVSTDGGTIWQNVGSAVSRHSPTPAWRYHVVPLTGVSGPASNARVGLLGISEYGNDVYVDDIAVDSLTAPPVTFSQGFEGATFPPVGWTAINKDGSGTAWARSTTYQHTGTASSYHPYSAAGMQDGWLITPAITLPSGVAAVSFWERAQFPTYYFRHTLWICTTGCGAPPTNWTQLSEFPGISGDWRQQTVSLNAYAGLTVYLGFRYEGNNADDWYVDDVTVGAILGWTSSCLSPGSGSLVVGRTTDSNTGEPKQATVSSDTDLGTIAAWDSPSSSYLYSLFVTAGSRQLTAAMPLYQDEVQDLVVPEYGTVGLDLALDAPMFGVSPSSLSRTVLTGTAATTPLTVANTGTAAGAFSLLEAPALPSPAPPARRYELAGVPCSGPDEMAPGGSDARRPETWVTASPIPSGTRYRSAGLSPDGRYVYVFGGWSGTNTVMAESWKYDTQLNAWTALAPMPTALTNIQAAAIGHIVYLVGGYDGGSHTNHFMIYDTLGNTWNISTWPKARTPMVAACNGILYAFGGAPGPSDETWSYNPHTGQWSGPLASMPMPVQYGAAVTVGDYIFVIGGGTPDTQVQRYSPATNTWDASGPQLPNGRMSPSLFWYGDRIYLVGGGGLGSIWNAYSDTLTLDPAAWPGGSWTTQGETVPTPVVAPAFGCANNRLYLSAGTSGGLYYDTTQYLDDGKTCHAAYDLSWLSVSPAGANVASQGSESLTVTFNAGAIHSPGTYTGLLQVVHYSPYSVADIPVTMNVVYPPVVATAGASTTSGIRPVNVTFSGGASGGDGGPYTWDWDFGDGTPHSTDQNPYHSYLLQGDYAVILTVADGHFNTATDTHLSIHVDNPAPVVTDVLPTTGSTNGGTSVTVTGTSFTGATAVVFGSTNAASFTVDSDTQITAASPAYSAGLVDIAVTTPWGTSTSSSADQFTFISPPVVTGLNPTTGPLAGGTSVVISGTGFGGATTVIFGATPVPFLVNSGTQITATAPAHAAGTIDVTVTTPYGTSALTAADRFTYVSPPTVTGINPATGPTAGGTTVTVTGTSFSGSTAVSFGGSPAASFTVSSGTQITATSPAHVAGTVDITVTTPYGTSATGAPDQFTYVAPPAVTGVNPATGPTAGGTSVVVTGTALAGASAVKFGGANASSFTVNSATQVTATSPAGSAGTVDITVTTPYGTSATSVSDRFTYMPPPAVTGISPAAGPTAGGTSVVITGSTFGGATSVKFGAASAASFTVTSDSQITTTSPAASAGVVDVTVTTPYGTSATSTLDRFTYVAPPAVTGVNPATGATAGGTSVVITGTTFSGATSVKFGTANAAGFTVTSATQVTAVSPAHSAGMVDITVTTPYGSSGAVTADRFTFVSPPAVTGISPSRGPVTGGTSVVIVGSDFSGATSVSFGGTPASTFSVYSGSQITATSPAHAAGVVDVLVTTPYGTSAAGAADLFAFIPPPTLSGLSPVKGSTAGGAAVAIAGTGFQSGAAVTFDGVPSPSVIVVSDVLITATTPAHAAGAASVRVTNPDGQSATAAGAFTYIDPPVITFAKAGGVPLVLTLNGSNFHNPCTISINGTAVPTTKWKSAILLKGKGSTLKVLLPKRVQVLITVTNGDDGIGSVPFPYTR